MLRNIQKDIYKLIPMRSVEIEERKILKGGYEYTVLCSRPIRFSYLLKLIDGYQLDIFSSNVLPHLPKYFKYYDNNI